MNTLVCCACSQWQKGIIRVKVNIISMFYLALSMKRIEQTTSGLIAEAAAAAAGSPALLTMYQKNEKKEERKNDANTSSYLMFASNCIPMQAIQGIMIEMIDTFY